ncbi:MAG: ABC transporter substrate-binding protein [Proteobacteria bacterium]|nr:MAG: ABC transporter substrate-binding protein [Pseudomonadota bacterium]
MRRREVITLIGGTAAAWPLAARAQKAAIPVIGYLHSGVPGGVFVDAFRRGLTETGYVEGQNVRIEYRFGEGRYDTMRAHVLDLLALGVAAIAVQSTGGALAAKSATSTTPIVFAIGSDPVNAGLVERLNRPGGNLTGATLITHALDAKRLQMIHEMVPGASTVGALFNPKNADAERQLPDLKVAARTLGQDIRVLNASTKAEIDAVFKKLAEQRVDALIVISDAFLNEQNEQIAALASAFSIPVIAARREFAASGILLSYGPRSTEVMRQQGIYIGRILKGEKPGDLPVVQPTKFELVINTQTARMLGLTVPPSLLATADEVIE